MSDLQNRVVIDKEWIKESNLEASKEVHIYYEPEYKRLILKKEKNLKDMCLVKTHILDQKCRIAIPYSVRNAFPGATYFPVKINGEICILIIEHEKKSE